mgnify:CR=1 FL=1
MILEIPGLLNSSRAVETKYSYGTTLLLYHGTEDSGLHTGTICDIIAKHGNFQLTKKKKKKKKKKKFFKKKKNKKKKKI